jgi:hypothetical protein
MSDYDQCDIWAQSAGEEQQSPHVCPDCTVGFGCKDDPCTLAYESICDDCSLHEES